MSLISAAVKAKPMAVTDPSTAARAAPRSLLPTTTSRIDTARAGTALISHLFGGTVSVPPVGPASRRKAASPSAIPRNAAQVRPPGGHRKTTAASTSVNSSSVVITGCTTASGPVARARACAAPERARSPAPQRQAGRRTKPNRPPAVSARSAAAAWRCSTEAAALPSAASSAMTTERMIMSCALRDRVGVEGPGQPKRVASRRKRCGARPWTRPGAPSQRGTVISPRLPVRASSTAAATRPAGTGRGQERV